MSRVLHSFILHLPFLMPCSQFPPVISCSVTQQGTIVYPCCHSRSLFFLFVRGCSPRFLIKQKKESPLLLAPGVHQVTPDVPHTTSRGGLLQIRMASAKPTNKVLNQQMDYRLTMQRTSFRRSYLFVHIPGMALQ